MHKYNSLSHNYNDFLDSLKINNENIILLTETVYEYLRENICLITFKDKSLCFVSIVRRKIFYFINRTYIVYRP